MTVLGGCCWVWTEDPHSRVLRPWSRLRALLLGEPHPFNKDDLLLRSGQPAKTQENVTEEERTSFLCFIWVKLWVVSRRERAHCLLSRARVTVSSDLLTAWQGMPRAESTMFFPLVSLLAPHPGHSSPSFQVSAYRNVVFLLLSFFLSDSIAAPSLPFPPPSSLSFPLVFLTSFLIFLFVP